MNTSIVSVGSVVPIGFRSFAASEHDDNTVKHSGEISFAEA